MYNETKKACNNRYLAKFSTVLIRITPEEKTEIEKNAKNAGKSVSKYLKDLGLQKI